VRSGNQQQRRGNHDHTITSRHPSPAQKVRKSTDSPRGEQEVQHPEENECAWSDEENEQLCSATEEHQEKGGTNKGEHWRKKERGATTISLPPVANARKEQGKQNVEGQRSASMLLRLLSNSHAAIVAHLQVLRMI
jgi:hypothetical protein